jgi:hypothetical protein
VLPREAQGNLFAWQFRGEGTKSGFEQTDTVITLALGQAENLITPDLGLSSSRPRSPFMALRRRTDSPFINGLGAIPEAEQPEIFLALLEKAQAGAMNDELRWILKASGITLKFETPKGK